MQTLSLLWEEERNRRRQIGMDSQPSQPVATQFIREPFGTDEIEQAMIKRIEEIKRHGEIEPIVASQVRVVLSKIK